MRSLQIYRSAALLLFVLPTLGCDQRIPRHPISGSVSVDGQPLDNATIVFTPVGEGLSGAAEVINGQFTCSEVGGPSAGMFDVRISSNEAEIEQVADDPTVLKNNPRRPKVPPQYQRPGGLQVEITGDPAQTLTLDLKR